MSDILRMVGDKIREYRKAIGLSQEELGERADVHYTYIGGLERGQRNISLANLYKISNSLGISISELVDIDNPKSHDAKDMVIEGILNLLSELNEDEVKMASDVLYRIFQTQKKSEN
ncbi:helix-turn-helix transcriptional regulator [Paenibacillus alkaliterrae]|uniref:helix-turn-helix domain-containing protein n=1 Tax=Paenibacillus alkaliterrae TaxID=320909 RepID=UPI001F4224B7|nr:helix-turn-helix transcriptional regulator [Paenibacillus alkaliterrae]MCF2940134.1 helix-turn-helix transcriptional regulator [Paenibacillus alkaliterrae]